MNSVTAIIIRGRQSSFLHANNIIPFILTTSQSAFLSKEKYFVRVAKQLVLTSNKYYLMLCLLRISIESKRIKAVR